MGLQSLIQKRPGETLQRLHRWISTGEPLEMRAVADAVSDPDLHWIVKNNLKKNRLLKKFPEQVEAKSRRL